MNFQDSQDYSGAFQLPQGTRTFPGRFMKSASNNTQNKAPTLPFSIVIAEDPLASNIIILD